MDIFEIGPTSAAEPKPEQPEQKEVQSGQYIIQLITPLFPGWLACYDDQDDPERVIMFPVIGLALVVLAHADGRQEQTIRHLVSTPAGQVEDVADIPGFICVLGPGQSPEAIVPAMRQMRDAAS